jgi:hypothetical protein
VRRRVGIVLGALVAVAVTQPASITLAETSEATLEGRAVLPADTFGPGPPSGAALEDETKYGREPPFKGQPVGGFSAVLSGGGGEYLAMTDNGFATKGDSADFLLRVYRIRPDFETARGGSGEISVEDFVQLRDPDRQVPFKITLQSLAPGKPVAREQYSDRIPTSL